MPWPRRWQRCGVDRRAADGNRKLWLALRDIAGHDRIEQLRPGLPELLGLGMVQNKVGDFLIETGHGAHLGIVERIGQEADVDHNVRLDGMPCLKPNENT